MTTLDAKDPLAIAATEAIHIGDVDRLHDLLDTHPELVTVRFVDDACDGSRTLLAVATDWPGHFPNGPAIVALLAAAGADVNARFGGTHDETPLHGAASSNDVDVLDALLDAGADIDAPGAVIAGGAPLDDAVAFGQWSAAHRLVERGAQTALWHAAALGLMDRVTGHFEQHPLPAPHPWGASHDAVPPGEVTVAFWCACHGGQHQPAEYLLARGGELSWVSVWDGLTPLDTAQREAARPPAEQQAAEADIHALIRWLRSQGAMSASELS